VVYQDEDGQWVTDLAYYSSFEKEVDGKTPEDVSHFQNEDFVPAGWYTAPRHHHEISLMFGRFINRHVFFLLAGDALEKLAQDEEEFEKEHQFMQVRNSPRVLSLVVRGDASRPLRLSAAALRFILSAGGFVRSWKTWKRHGILKWSFPGLEKSWKKLKS